MLLPILLVDGPGARNFVGGALLQYVIFAIGLLALLGLASPWIVLLFAP